MYQIFRSILWALSQDDHEKAHELALRWGGRIQDSPLLLWLVETMCLAELNDKPYRLWGINFPNRVGIAAGVDKDGKIPLLLQAFGPGFITIGSVLPFGQYGNPRPRVFRLKEHEALINALGFNGSGAEVVKERLEGVQSRLSTPLFISLGKMKGTSLEDAAKDYKKTIAALWDSASVFTLCISSPNTPGLRELQSRGYLKEFVREIVGFVKSCAMYDQPRPVLVKWAPDIKDAEVESMLDDCIDGGASGLVLANTTIGRPGVENHRYARVPGGLSGPPVYERMMQLLTMVRRLDNNFPIVAVGGINSRERALRAIGAGANLVKINTGLIYRGPALIREIKQALAV